MIMNKNSLILVFALLLLQILESNQVFGQTFPLKLSSTGRYFVDQDNKPFLINGDTPWQLPVKLTIEEIEDYLDNRKVKKINTIQIMLTSFREVNGANRDGVKPFVNANDFTVRNEAYFDFVADVLKAAEARGIAVIIAPLWQDSPNAAENVTWRPSLQANGVDKCRSFGNYLGTKFNLSQHPNLMAWLMGGDNIIDYTYPYYNAIAEGIKEKDAKVFQSYHIRGGQASTDAIHDNWLNLNSTYTYAPDHIGTGKRHVYDLSYHAYNRIPVMPFYLSEALYEGPARNNKQDNATPETIRRQAYWSMLGGSAGHIYGALLYNIPSNWKELMDLPGAFDLAHLYNFFTGFEWSKLVPDINHTFVTTGYGTYDGFTAAGDNYVTAALSSDKRLGIAYLPSTGTDRRTLTVNMSTLKAKVICKWFNPNTGEYLTIGKYANKGSRNFITPGNNGDNANDWILFLESR